MWTPKSNTQMRFEDQLRVVCINVDVNENETFQGSFVHKANAKVSKLKKGQIDLLVLPEMAFNPCSSNSTVERLISHTSVFQNGFGDCGIQNWAVSVAIELETHVLFGIPEQDQNETIYSTIILATPSGSLVRVNTKVLSIMRPNVVQNPSYCWVEIVPPRLQKVVRIVPWVHSMEFDCKTSTLVKETTSQREMREVCKYAEKEQAHMVICCSTVERINNADNEEACKEISRTELYRYWVQRCYPLYSYSAGLIVCAKEVSAGSQLSGLLSGFQFSGPLRLLGYSDNHNQELGVSAMGIEVY